MAITENTYTGNGTSVLFPFTFPYLDSADVKVTLNGTLTTAYTFANATTIQFTSAPAAGVSIRIYRETANDEASATFFPGSSIKASDLNNNFTQILYAVQEVVSRYISKFGGTMLGILNMGGFKIINVGTPTLDADSATKKYVDDRYGQLTVPGVTRWRQTATAGQTVFSGAGEYGGTLAYSASRETVFINGALQQRNVDYTADNGTTVIFAVALEVGDVVDIHCVNNANGTTTDQASGIYWTQTGSGAVTRTVDSKLKDVVSVKDFGAVGNGVADDTAAIQAAIAATLTNRGGVVFFPPGIYCFANTLSLSGANKGISLIGSGSSLAGQNNAPTVLKWIGGASIAVDVGADCRNSSVRSLDFENTGTCTSFIRVGVTDGFLIQEVCMRPTVFPSTAAIILGIAAANPGRCDHAILRDINIFGNGVGQVGVLADRAQDCRMFNAQLLQCRLVLGMSGSMDIVDFEWFGGSISTFTDEPAAAIEIKQCRGATFHGLHMERNGGSAAFLEVSGSGTTDARGINVYGGYISGTSTTSQIFRLNWAAADVLISGVTTVQLAPAYNFVSNIASRSVTLIGNSLVAGATEVSGATGYSNVVAFGNVIDSLRQTPRGLVTASLVTAANGDTSPSVRGLNSLWFNNSSSTIITNLSNAIDGQVVTCVFNDSNTTINRSNAYLLGGTNFTSTAGDTLTLIYRTPYWYEISRSANS